MRPIILEMKTILKSYFTILFLSLSFTNGACVKEKAHKQPIETPENGGSPNEQLRPAQSGENSKQDFSSFLGLSAGDTYHKATEIFGPPSEIEDYQSVKSIIYRGSNNLLLLSISYRVTDSKITTITTFEETYDWSLGKKFYDEKLLWLRKSRGEIISGFTKYEVSENLANPLSLDLKQSMGKKNQLFISFNKSDTPVIFRVEWFGLLP